MSKGKDKIMMESKKNDPIDRAEKFLKKLHGLYDWENIEDPSEYFTWENVEDGIKITGIKDAKNIMHLPESVAGKKIVSLGEKCFADLSLLEEIYVPDSVKSIENLAFYNCRGLRKIEFGAYIEDVGSDIFMNCFDLKELAVRAGVREKTGMGYIVSRYSGNIYIHFTGSPQMKIFFPEIREDYDEVTPAHIFSRNFKGMGFRLRQMFDEGIFQSEEYDDLYEKMECEEDKKTMCLIAAYRLIYPTDLTEERKKKYESRIRRDGFITGKYFLETDQQEVIKDFYMKGYISDKDMDNMIDICGDMEWTEKRAYLMDLKLRENMLIKKRRYEF